MNTEELLRYAELDEKKKLVEVELDKIKASMNEVEHMLIDDLIMSGINSLKLSTGRTIYIHNQIWAKISDRKEAINALKEAGMTEYIEENFNTNSISAYVRETIKNGDELPDSFEGIISSNPKRSLRTIKS